MIPGADGLFPMPQDRRTVAIVDDDIGLGKSMVRILKAFGYESELFGSAEEFLNHATKTQASCLLVDVNLGDLSGIELVRELANASLVFPVIFMTGCEDEILRSQAIDLGCVAYLSKPCQVDLLISAIDVAMQTP